MPTVFTAAGIESGAIPDSAISASSNYRSNDPYKGRLNASGDQCWATLTLNNPYNEWWQVDLGATKWVGKFATQGRDGPTNQRITNYKLRYSSDGTTWTDYNGGQVLTGNTDRTTVVSNTLTPFKARYVRLYPVTWNSWVSARFEVYVAE